MQCSEKQFSRLVQRDCQLYDSSKKKNKIKTKQKSFDVSCFLTLHYALLSLHLQLHITVHVKHMHMIYMYPCLCIYVCMLLGDRLRASRDMFHSLSAFYLSHISHLDMHTHTYTHTHTDAKAASLERYGCSESGAKILALSLDLAHL